jgi:hypothetical protein
MAEYKHGSMDIETQEKTFASFIRITTYGAIAVILFLIFLALVNG